MIKIHKRNSHNENRKYYENGTRTLENASMMKKFVVFKPEVSWALTKINCENKA